MTGYVSGAQTGRKAAVCRVSKILGRLANTS
jgi:hypothetical protein